MNELKGRGKMNQKKKSTRRTHEAQSFEPSKAIKKKGCGCGKKKNK
jgi:hypothetical protein